MGDHVYRYHVTDVWGSLVGKLVIGDHILEREDHGPDRTLTIMDVHTGAHIGGAYGEFDGIAEVCRCGLFLADAPHDCDARRRPRRRGDEHGRRKATDG